MKKFLAAILAFFYLSTATGVTLHYHYCMGKLVNYGLTYSNSSTCGKCGMEKNPESDNRCCKDECKQIKVDTEHKPSKNFRDLNGATFQIGLVAFSDYSNSINPILLSDPKINPPPRSRPSLNIMNCIFRI